VTVHEFLKQEPLPGGFHEHRKFVQQVRDELLGVIDEEVRSAMGLIDESQYAEVFARYVNHVSHWVKKEKVRNPVTNRYEDPDDEMMSEVERTLAVGTTPGQVRTEEFRRDVISRIAAWSIDHPQERLDYALVFPRQFQLLREAYFNERRKTIRKTIEDVLVFLAEGKPPAGVDGEARQRVETTVTNLRSRYGYCEKCAKEAVSFLLRKRYSA